MLTDPSFANFPTLCTQPSFSFSYLKLFRLSGISITSVKPPMGNLDHPERNPAEIRKRARKRAGFGSRKHFPKSGCSFNFRTTTIRTAAIRATGKRLYDSSTKPRALCGRPLKKLHLELASPSGDYSTFLCLLLSFLIANPLILQNTFWSYNI